MKGLIIFLLGIAVGALGLHFYRESRTGEVALGAEAANSFEQVRDRARSAGDRLSAKLAEWNLDTEQIKRDLVTTGQVIRNKARSAGARVDDARIVSLIKAKYVLDEELKPLDIKVDCRDGYVTLRGQVPHHASVGRAVALALETDGVVEVRAELRPQTESAAGS